MAAVILWKDLPEDLLLGIAKMFNSDVDIIRLRSVCSRWRSTIHPRYRPSSFPLRLPPVLSDHSTALREGMGYFLNYSSIIRISPPEFGPYAGDPSDGFLVRVLEVNPNTFHTSPVLCYKTFEKDSPLFPKHVNLLNFRVTEICKSYNFDPRYFRSYRDYEYLISLTRKMVVLWNYNVNCEFAVLLLLKQGFLLKWKFGDENWSPLISRGHRINDLVLYDGRCYAISRKGIIVLVDSEFNLVVAPLLPPLPVDCRKFEFFLSEYKSDLYVLSKFCDKDDTSDEDNATAILYGIYVMSKFCEEDETSDEDNATANQYGGNDDDEGSNEIPLVSKIFKKSNGTWEKIDLEDTLILFGPDLSFGLSLKDISGCICNCVSPEEFPPNGRAEDMTAYGDSVRSLGEGLSDLCSRPPKWLFV